MKRPKRTTIGFQHTAPSRIQKAATAIRWMNSSRAILNFSIKTWEEGTDNTDSPDFKQWLYLSPRTLIEVKVQLQMALDAVESVLEETGRVKTGKVTD